MNCVRFLLYMKWALNDKIHQGERMLSCVRDGLNKIPKLNNNLDEEEAVLVRKLKKGYDK